MSKHFGYNSTAAQRLHNAEQKSFLLRQIELDRAHADRILSENHTHCVNFIRWCGDVLSGLKKSDFDRKFILQEKCRKEIDLRRIERSKDWKRINSNENKKHS